MQIRLISMEPHCTAHTFLFDEHSCDAVVGAGVIRAQPIGAGPHSRWRWIGDRLHRWRICGRLKQRRPSGWRLAGRRKR
jgi:hypothetical protein